MDGKIARFSEAKGSRKYLAKGANEFSATRQFPPAGHHAAELVATGKVIEGKYNGGDSFRLERIVRKAKSLGRKAPKKAVVLFDGSNKDEWTGGRVDAKTKLLNTDGKDIKTKRKFSNYRMHVEFMLPYKPAGRGQGRGNSGFYQVDHYEVQILDSFGLEGLNNECGGVYSKKASDVNACLPPLQWQTYDVNFTNAVVKDGKGEKRPHDDAPQRHRHPRQHRDQRQDRRQPQGPGRHTRPDQAAGSQQPAAVPKRLDR